MDTVSKDEVNAKLDTVEARFAAKVDVLSERFDSLAEYVRLQADRAWEAAAAAARSAEAAARSAEAAERSAAKIDGLKQTIWISSITTILFVLAIAVASYLGSQQSTIAIAQAVTAAYQMGASQRQSPPPPSSTPSAPTQPPNR